MLTQYKPNQKYYAIKSIRKENVLDKQYIIGTLAEKEIMLKVKSDFHVKLAMAF